MAEEKKKTEQELVEEHGRLLHGSTGDELACNTEKFTSDDASLLKFHGTYKQDDRDACNQRKAGIGKSDRPYLFMVRRRANRQYLICNPCNKHGRDQR